MNMPPTTGSSADSAPTRYVDTRLSIGLWVSALRRADRAICRHYGSLQLTCPDAVRRRNAFVEGGRRYVCAGMLLGSFQNAPTVIGVRKKSLSIPVRAGSWLAVGPVRYLRAQRALPRDRPHRHLPWPRSSSLRITAAGPTVPGPDELVGRGGDSQPSLATQQTRSDRGLGRLRMSLIRSVTSSVPNPI